jgi:hypothetical protein
MAVNTPNQTAESSNITKCLIYSNRGSGSQDVSPGIVDFSYFESVLDTTVRFSIVIVDTGNSTESTNSEAVLYKLKLSGFEKVDLSFTDNFDNKLDFSGNNALYINKIRNIISHSEKTIFTIDLVSKEYLANEFLKSEVYQRFDGEISTSVRSILSDILNTEKDIISDPTSNTLNFYGSGKKPFTLISEIGTKGVPQGGESTAGYFIFENYNGFNFRSIDALFKSPVVKSFIYNSTTLLPKEYDAKIISYKSKKTIDVQENLKSGAYGGRLETFNPYTHKFNPVSKNVENEDQETKGGLEFSKISPDFSFYGSLSRRYYHRMDVGQVPSGNKTEQLKNRKKENLNSKDVIVQSAMSYNKIFSLSVDVTIPGDFSLRSGQLVYCDFPEQSSKRNIETDRELSGIYMICDICHHITPGSSLTKMNLIRDSFGRNPSKGGS